MKLPLAFLMAAGLTILCLLSAGETSPQSGNASLVSANQERDEAMVGVVSVGYFTAYFSGQGASAVLAPVDLGELRIRGRPSHRGQFLLLCESS